MKRKACPFCGTRQTALKPKRREPHLGYTYVECVFCGIRGPVVSTSEAANRYWNDRKTS